MYVRPFFTIFFLWLCLYVPLSICTFIYIDLLCLWYSMFLLNQIIWFEWKKNWTLIKVTLDNFSGSADAKSEKKQPKKTQTNKPKKNPKQNKETLNI